MTNSELTELLQHHVRESEPGPMMPVETVVSTGRRTVRRRRLGAGVAIAALAVAAVVVVPHTFGTNHDSGIAPATQQALKEYNAGALPGLIDTHVRNALAGSLDLPEKSTFHALDSQGISLPAKDWDKASQALAEYDAGAHRFEVSLTHSKSEAEGNVRRLCASAVENGYELSCTVSNTGAGLARQSVAATLPLRDRSVVGWSWAAITRADVEHGTLPKWLKEERGVHGPDLDPSQLWFSRSVEVVHSKTFVTTAIEYVHASTYAEAKRMFKVPVAALTSIATDPALVIPQPPTGGNGCPWMLHPEGASCG